MSFKPDVVNAAFDLTFPELASKYARYPLEYGAWYAPNDSVGDKPCFITSEKNLGLKMDYVYCNRGPVGKGYYHLLTKIAYVNLTSYLYSMGGGGPACCGGGNREKADALDTTKRVLYARSRASRPNDRDAQEQCVDHYVGTKLNPVHGITG